MKESKDIRGRGRKGGVNRGKKKKDEEGKIKGKVRRKKTEESE